MPTQNVSAEDLLELLTLRQHTHPHRTVQAVLSDACRTTGACRIAVDRAVQWLELNDQTPIGRLRRTEMMQLARSIHRFWRTALAREAAKA